MEHTLKILELAEIVQKLLNSDSLNKKNLKELKLNVKEISQWELVYSNKKDRLLAKIAYFLIKIGIIKKVYLRKNIIETVFPYRQTSKGKELIIPNTENMSFRIKTRR